MTFKGEAPNPAPAELGFEGEAYPSASPVLNQYPNFMAQVGSKVVDQGYNILPLMPGTKVPGEFKNGIWRPMREWTRFADRLPTDAELRVWSEVWPETGVGILCGKFVGLDIDVLDSGVALAVQEEAVRELGETPLVRIGLAPKRLLGFQSAERFTPIKRHPLEALGYGNQCVAYGIHPATGRPYAWPDGDLVSVHVDDLPAVTEDQVRAFLAKAERLIPPEMRQRRLGPDLSDEVHTPGDLAGTPEAIRDALQYIPNDLDYDSWVSVAYAAKGALGPDGLDIFAQWSAQSPKDVPETTLKLWRDAKPDRVGAGSVYYHAGRNGWTLQEGHYRTPYDKKVAESGAGQALLAALDARRDVRVAQDAQMAPEGLEQDVEAQKADALAPSGTPPATSVLPVPTADPLKPGGIMGRLMSECLASARRQQPTLALGAAIATVGTAAGRRYVGPTGLAPNTYVGLLAKSGSGKEHPLKFVSRALHEAGLGKLIAGRSPTGETALERVVYAQPTTLFVFDELAKVLRPMLSDSEHQSVAQGGATWFVEAFTRTDGVMLGKEFANPTVAFGAGQPSRRDIHHPHVSIIGVTNEASLWDVVGTRAMLDGFIGRWLFLAAPKHLPYPAPAEMLRVSPELADGLRAVREGAAGHNYELIQDLPDLESNPYRVPIGEDAEAWMDALERAQIDYQNGLPEGDLTSSVFGRLTEQTYKLALIHAISANPGNPVIDMTAVQWAYSVALMSAELIAHRTATKVADTSFERSINKALSFIHGTPSVAHSALLRHMKMPAKDLSVVVDWLIHSGKVLTANAKPGAGTHYRAV